MDAINELGKSLWQSQGVWASLGTCLMPNGSPSHIHRVKLWATETKRISRLSKQEIIEQRTQGKLTRVFDSCCWICSVWSFSSESNFSSYVNSRTVHLEHFRNLRWMKNKTNRSYPLHLHLATDLGCFSRTTLLKSCSFRLNKVTLQRSSFSSSNPFLNIR